MSAGTPFRRVLRPAYRRVRTGLGDVAFERRLGVHTDETIPLEELGVAGADRVHYGPSPWLVLPRLVPRRSVRPHDVFVDYGSGMGRVLVQAALRYPFRRVVGVELSEELNRIARENLERNRDRMRCRDVEVIAADAAEWAPPDDLTVAYFNNPFVGELFGRVLDNLVESVDRHPRRVRIVYRNPVEHERLVATGRVRVVRRLRGWRPGRERSRSNSSVLYELGPASDGG